MFDITASYPSRAWGMLTGADISSPLLYLEAEREDDSKNVVQFPSHAHGRLFLSIFLDQRIFQKEFGGIVIKIWPTSVLEMLSGSVLETSWIHIMPRI